ncbi:MAG: hypothetical protein AAF721_06070 [Myxococcota bacterium]
MSTAKWSFDRSGIATLLLVGACAVPPPPPSPPPDEPAATSRSSAREAPPAPPFNFAAVAVVRQQYEGAELVIHRDVVASDQGKENLLYSCRFRSDDCALDPNDPRVATSYRVGQEWTVVDDRGTRAIVATEVSVDDAREPATLEVVLGKDAPLSGWGLAFPTARGINPDARLMAPPLVEPTPPEIYEGLRALLTDTYGPNVEPPAEHIRVYRVSTPVASHLAAVAIPDDPLNPSDDEFGEPLTALYLFKSDGSLVDSLLPITCCTGMVEVQALVDLDGDGYEEIIWETAPAMMVDTALTLWHRGDAASISI